MELRPLTPSFGVEVCSPDPDPAELRAALIEHKVLLLRAPELTPDQHMALGRSIGEIEVHAFFPNLGEGHEQVSVLDSNEGNTATMWHTDESFLPHPPMGTLTRALVMPTVGGDTLFANTEAAHEALSPAMKRYLEGLEAWHDLGKIAPPGSVDFICFCEAFEHVERPLDALRKLLAALRPGGRLFFTAQRYGRDVQAAVRPGEPIYIGERMMSELPHRLNCRILDTATSGTRYYVVLEK